MTIDVLVEIFDPTYGSTKDLEKIVVAVEKICKDVKYEVPNSATFAMVIDALEEKRQIFKIKDAMPDVIEEPVIIARE